MIERLHRLSSSWRPRRVLQPEPNHFVTAVARAALLEGTVPKAAATVATVPNVEDPDVVYIDRTKRTPTKKRTNTPTKKKDSAKKRVLNKDSI